MPRLPEVGLVSYNGFDMPVTHKDFTIKGRPVLARDRRSISHTVYTLEFTFYVSGNDPDIAGLGEVGIEPKMARLRQSLQQPAGHLVVNLKGFGNLDLNGGGNSTDALWGPIPGTFNVRPMGGGPGGVETAEVRWGCTFAIPESAAQRFKGILEYSYRVKFGKDASGLTTRAVTGVLSIAQTRKAPGDPTLQDNAENYLQQVEPEVPIGFRRMVSEHDLDESKCVMTWNFQDVELPSTNSYPPNVIICECAHRIKCSDKGFKSWVGELFGTYETSREVPRITALQEFRKIVRNRLSAAVGTPGVEGVPLPLAYELVEPQVYGKTTGQFSVAYSMICDFASVVAASGIWRPVPENDFQAWATSMKNIYRGKGLAGLGFSNDMDVICSLTETKAVPAVPKG